MIDLDGLDVVMTPSTPRLGRGHHLWVSLQAVTLAACVWGLSTAAIAWQTYRFVTGEK